MHVAPSTRVTGALALFALALAPSACSSPSPLQQESEFKLGIQKHQPSEPSPSGGGARLTRPPADAPPTKLEAPQDEQPPSYTELSGEGRPTFAGLYTADRELLDLAKDAKMPPPAMKDKWAGPFALFKDTLIYAHQSGHLTFYYPRARLAFFASTAPLKWRYQISSDGYASFGEDGTLIAHDRAPAQLATWPQALPIAQQVVIYVNAVNQAEALDQPAPTGIRELSDVERVRLREELTAQLSSPALGALSTINSPECTQRFEEATLLGCY